MIRIRSPKDFVAGILFSAVAVTALWFARDLDYGTARQMGSGFIPRWLAMILLALGVAIIGRGLVAVGNAWEAISLPRLATILVAIVVFGLSIGTLGLVISTFACALIAASAGNERRKLEALTLGAALAAFSGLLFVYALRLPFPLWPNL